MFSMDKQEKIDREIEKTQQRANRHYERNKPFMEKVKINDITADRRSSNRSDKSQDE